MNANVLITGVSFDDALLVKELLVRIKRLTDPDRVPRGTPSAETRARWSREHAALARIIPRMTISPAKQP